MSYFAQDLNDVVFQLPSDNWRCRTQFPRFQRGTCQVLQQYIDSEEPKVNNWIMQWFFQGVRLSSRLCRLLKFGAKENSSLKVRISEVSVVRLVLSQELHPFRCHIVQGRCWSKANGKAASWPAQIIPQRIRCNDLEALTNNKKQPLHKNTRITPLYPQGSDHPTTSDLEASTRSDLIYLSRDKEPRAERLWSHLKKCWFVQE